MMYRDEAADRRMAETPSLAAYLPYILAYPLRGHGPAVWLMLTIMLWFGMQSVMGIAMFAIAAPWTFHYAEAVIDQSALGRATPPNFGGDMIYLGGMRAMQPLVGALPIVGAYVLTLDAGRGSQLVLIAASALLYPAFLLVLAAEGNLYSALNPLRAVKTMFSIGAPYFLVCGLLGGVAALAIYAVGSLALFGALLVTIYLLMVVFHLLGYVAFHNHEKLGLLLKRPPPTDESRALEAQGERLKAVLSRIDTAATPEEGYKALLAENVIPGDPRLFHEELFEQLQHKGQVQAKREPLLHAQGARLIGVLLRGKRAARALDIAETCYDFHRDFQFEVPAHAVELAQLALQQKRLGLFRRLTHDAAARYGADPAAVSLAFLTARDAYENGHDEARARDILQPLLMHVGHPWARQIAAYARALTLAPPKRQSSEGGAAL